jgi:3-hydroxyacyl-CoA dehydrogenase / enoyl-CoA hydratase / 3-hydroxybutyryl-CoA epimerase
MNDSTSQENRESLQQIQNWTLEADKQDIAWLGLRTSSSTNVLSRQVLLELSSIIDALLAAPPSGLIIFSHKDGNFIAGADVHEFPQLTSTENAYEQVRAGQKILDRLEALPFTTVAVLNGITLGGGLELALACDWRLSLASDRPSIGLPEIQLGLHPGLGGTLRCPRLIGVRSAMQLMLTGKPVTPADAMKMGLIDEICDAESWRTTAAEFVRRTRPAPSTPIADRLLSLGLLRPLLATILRRQVVAKAPRQNYPAPYALIDLWQRGWGHSDALEMEARSFAELVFSQTSKNLVRVFFLQDRLKDLAKTVTARVSHVHVIGAGTMGADIAAWCAIRGLTVTLEDRDNTFVAAGLERAAASIRKKLKTDTLVADATARLVADQTGEGARVADVIIEAIFENLEAKQKLFLQVEQRARPDAILATNTSSIPLKEIASCLASPPRLVGLHFFNPVALMPLVEVVHTPTTLHGVVDSGAAFVRQLGKLALPCRGLPGFLVNRILAPYMDEAFRLLQEGLTPEAIDKAATDFGMPVGPLELADSVGLDILLHVAGIVGETIRRGLPPGLTELVNEGRLGRKSGHGFYRWENGKAIKNRDKNATYPPEAQRRLVLSLVNEAVACLQDRVVADADLVDAGTIFGTGFAPFRGGPLQYARQTGLSSLRQELEQFQRQYGERFAPSAGWDFLAES